MGGGAIITPLKSAFLIGTGMYCVLIRGLDMHGTFEDKRLLVFHNSPIQSKRVQPSNFFSTLKMITGPIFHSKNKTKIDFLVNFLLSFCCAYKIWFHFGCAKIISLKTFSILIFWSKWKIYCLLHKLFFWFWTVLKSGLQKAENGHIINCFAQFWNPYTHSQQYMVQK